MESVAFMLARRIRRLRERAGLNQTELAREVLCSKSHISDIELARVLPTASEVRLMEQALDADGVLADLLDLVSIGIQESAIVADAERDAISMTVWEWRIYGILHTPDYMRAHMSPAVPPGRLERELAVRKARTRVLGSLVTGWSCSTRRPCGACTAAMTSCAGSSVTWRNWLSGLTSPSRSCRSRTRGTPAETVR